MLFVDKTVLANVYCYHLYMLNTEIYVAISAKDLDYRTRNEIVGYLHKAATGLLALKGAYSPITPIGGWLGKSRSLLVDTMF